VVRANQRQAAAGQDENRDGGFTLIELVIVVGIIAVLVGIAMPAYLGTSQRAHDAASKSNLRNALSAAETIFADNEAYLATPTMVTSLGADEPNLTFKNETTPSTAAKEVSIATSASTVGGTVDSIILASQSASGTCWYYRHVSAAGLASAGTYYATTGSGTACQAGNAPTTATDWTAL